MHHVQLKQSAAISMSWNIIQQPSCWAVGSCISGLYKVINLYTFDKSDDIGTKRCPILLAFHIRLRLFNDTRALAKIPKTADKKLSPVISKPRPKTDAALQVSPSLARALSLPPTTHLGLIGSTENLISTLRESSTDQSHSTP
jgi:hypothetical protein